MAAPGTKRVLIVLGIVAVLGGLWAVALSIGDLMPGGAVTRSDDFDEDVLIEGDSGDKVAMINVVGEIFSDPTGEAGGASDTNVVRQLEIAAEDPDVVAIILNLETPGGTVVASDNIYTEVLEVREDKPVVALMNDVAASGGYYIAAAADEIVAHSATWTGSIGVIAMVPNLEETADKVGVRVNVLKSGDLKDIGSPFRPMTDQERAILQTLVDEAYAGFVDAVATGRDMTPERIRELADGRIYSGRQAMNLGLVDHLGNREFAFGRAKGLSRSPDASLVIYRERRGLFEDLIPFARAPGAAEVAAEELGFLRNPGAAYLWLP